MPRQIAELWGITNRQLSSHAYRWRKAGIRVALAPGNQRVHGGKPIMANRVVPKIAEHGVGWGVTDCKCELCNVSRRAKRATANVNYRKRRKLRREAAAKLAAE